MLNPVPFQQHPDRISRSVTISLSLSTYPRVLKVSHTFLLTWGVVGALTALGASSCTIRSWMLNSRGAILFVTDSHLGLSDQGVIDKQNHSILWYHTSTSSCTKQLVVIGGMYLVVPARHLVVMYKGGSNSIFLPQSPMKTSEIIPVTGGLLTCLNTQLTCLITVDCQWSIAAPSESSNYTSGKQECVADLEYSGASQDWPWNRDWLWNSAGMEWGWV